MRFESGGWLGYRTEHPYYPPNADGDDEDDDDDF
jgi:hypothetical protein